MDYIYDIVLNFQTNYYDFYEWKTTDKVINIKKILIYKVNNENYLNLKYNDVILDKKMLPKETKIFLVTNGIEVMGILLDKEGKIIKKSSLLFEEADEVLEEKETLKPLPIKYKQNIIKKPNIKSRNEIEQIKFLEKYFSNIDIKKDEYLLKYIYYEIYNKEGKNLTNIYQELKQLIDTNVTKLYKCIEKIHIEQKK